MNTNVRLPGWGSSQVAILIYYAQSEGLAIEAILRGSDITESLLEQKDPSLNQELIVIQNLLELLPHHPFELGLNIGNMCNANSFGLFGQVLVASRSAKQIVKAMTNFLSGDHDFITVFPRIQDGKIVTTYKVSADLSDDAAQFILGRSMGATIVLQEDVLAGLPGLTTEVGFIGAELPGMTKVGVQYGCGVKFQQSTNYLHSHISVLNLEFPLGNSFLSNILFKRARNYLYKKREKSIENQGMHARIARLLNDAGYRNISKEIIASKLNMSSRTLARRLFREGTNWRDLYVKLRMERAKELLATTRESLDAIANKVGFLNTSSFSSAFSRSIGNSPHEYRLHKTRMLDQQGCPN
ncbi:MAG: helix-turn-helix domain-containing protein [Oleispira sp.]|nr:helix-turn-helix domain-containing protein [Oleispira sp.]MBL4880752.1 helix-turn-helix domain-containing protein [Oleispira sp.]